MVKMVMRSKLAPTSSMIMSRPVLLHRLMCEQSYHMRPRRRVSARLHDTDEAYNARVIVSRGVPASPSAPRRPKQQHQPVYSDSEGEHDMMPMLLFDHDEELPQPQPQCPVRRSSRLQVRRSKMLRPRWVRDMRRAWPTGPLVPTWSKVVPLKQQPMLAAVLGVRL